MAIYDDPEFFADYAKMPRSQHGLAGAGEWPDFKLLLPDLTDKSVLDLGCGYGWQCRYVATHGAALVTGIDNSQKMLEQARNDTDPKLPITYQLGDLATYTEPSQSYDVVISSLALHYIQDLNMVMQHISSMLKPHGKLVFSIEHPIFTAEGSQTWRHDDQTQQDYWPMDHYFDESARQANFLGHTVTKYHHTFSTIIEAVLNNGMTLNDVVEPQGEPTPADQPLPEWQRIPQMLLIKATKA